MGIMSSMWVVIHAFKLSGRYLASCPGYGCAVHTLKLCLFSDCFTVEFFLLQKLIYIPTSSGISSSACGSTLPKKLSRGFVTCTILFCVSMC